MTITESDRLANDAPKLKLLDGRQVQLHYGYGGLRRIEKHFGGVKMLMEALQDALGPKFYDAVFLGLLFGLWQTGITEEELEGQLDPADMQAHAETLNEALLIAFPKEAQEEARKAATDPNAATAANEPQSTLPGPTATTSPLSSVTDQMTSSGV
jgi:hypothetical protein